MSRFRVKSNRPGLARLCNTSRFPALCCSLSWSPRRLSFLRLFVGMSPTTLALKTHTKLVRARGSGRGQHFLFMLPRKFENVGSCRTVIAGEVPGRRRARGTQGERPHKRTRNTSLSRLLQTDWSCLVEEHCCSGALVRNKVVWSTLGVGCSCSASLERVHDKCTTLLSSVIRR